MYVCNGIFEQDFYQSTEIIYLLILNSILTPKKVYITQLILTGFYFVDTRTDSSSNWIITITQRCTA